MLDTPPPLLGHHSRHCVTLPQACLQTLQGGGPSQWRLQWKQGINRARAPKQLRLYVAGLDPTALDELLKRGVLPKIREPLLPNRLRHLEKDISHLPLDAREGSSESRLLEAAGAMAGVPFGWGGDDLTMVWPQWENGFGDVIAHTLLPLAEYAHAGPLASPLAVSGLRYPILAQLLKAIAPRACASERPNPPLLPHCNSSCYAAINLCGLDHLQVKDAWAAAATLDRAVGFRAANESNVTFVLPPPRASAGQGGSAPPPPPPPSPPLRVLLAAREAHRLKGTLTGDRLVVNQEELVETCGRGTVAVAGHELRLECRLMPAGLAMAEQAAMMQWADVYACMWGGDSIHALHLRRGAIVIEMINQKFLQHGPWAWIGQHKRWVTKQRDRRTSPPLRYSMASLNFSGAVLTNATRKCMAQFTKAWEAKRQAGDKRALKEDEPGRLWDCYWNANMRVEWAQLHGAIVRAVRAAVRTSVAAVGDT